MPKRKNKVTFFGTLQKMMYFCVHKNLVSTLCTKLIMKDIKRIVLTGGPCAGKTTALVRVIEHFSSLGFKVFTIPEVPTMFTQAGMNYLTDNQAFFYEGEKATLEIQLAL